MQHYYHRLSKSRLSLFNACKRGFLYGREMSKYRREMVSICSKRPVSYLYMPGRYGSVMTTYHSI